MREIQVGRGDAVDAFDLVAAVGIFVVDPGAFFYCCAKFAQEVKAWTNLQSGNCWSGG